MQWIKLQYVKINLRWNRIGFLNLKNAKSFKAVELNWIFQMDRGNA